MEKKLRIALTYQRPSPELHLIGKMLSGLGSVSMMPEWSPESYLEYYDIGVVVGPARVCPLARKRVLFVLGRTADHLIANWDAVVVTSEKARSLAFRRFGHGCRIVVAPPPLVGLHLARRRIVEPWTGLVHVSGGGMSLPESVFIMRTWGNQPFSSVRPEECYSDLEFNSLVKAGAVGFYPEDMEDGYDIQVRRHLALGGSVVCRKDKQVLGELADLCLDKIPSEKVKMKPIDCAGSKDEYNDKVLTSLRRIK